MLDIPLREHLAAPWRAVHRLRHDLTRLRRRVGDLSTATLALSNHFAESLLSGSPRYADSRKLNHYELTAHSQGGEDGILAEIFRRIGTTDRIFVEFGIGDALQTNTRYLLSLGWSGVWIDADASYVENARHRLADLVDSGRLEVVAAVATTENAISLLRDAEVAETFDLLSLDIDRNTYHLWKALPDYRPRVVAVEYNASIPPVDEWVVEYDPTAIWDGSLRFGAGLKSYELLGREMGYLLVGCNLAGVNAFFVREDLVDDRFLPPFTAEAHHEPPRYWLRWRIGHPATPPADSPDLADLR